MCELIGKMKPGRSLWELCLPALALIGPILWSRKSLFWNARTDKGNKGLERSFLYSSIGTNVFITFVPNCSANQAIARIWKKKVELSSCEIFFYWVCWLRILPMVVNVSNSTSASGFDFLWCRCPCPCSSWLWWCRWPCSSWLLLLCPAPTSLLLLWCSWWWTPFLWCPPILKPSSDDLLPWPSRLFLPPSAWLLFDLIDIQNAISTLRT